MQAMKGHTEPRGDLGLRVIRNDGEIERPLAGAPSALGKELSLREIVRFGYPHKDQPAPVREWKRREIRLKLSAKRERSISTQLFLVI